MFLDNIHAKVLEIILIVGFLLCIISLITNFVFTLWCFKLSYILLIIEIWLLALNAFTFICSIILRKWRSDGSVIYKNFSSSLCISSFNIFLIITNILLSLIEDILFYFIYFFFDFQLRKFEKNEDVSDNNSIKSIEKIMKKFMNNNNYGVKFFENDKDINHSINKIKMIRILPWVAININILIQIMTIIILSLLIKRIKLQSNFGFQQIKNNQSVRSGMLDNQNNLAISNNESKMNQVNHDHKKKSKKGEQGQTNNRILNHASGAARRKNKKNRKNEKKTRKRASIKKKSIK